jgi:hypothetical protein
MGAIEFAKRVWLAGGENNSLFGSQTQASSDLVNNHIPYLNALPIQHNAIG